MILLDKIAPIKVKNHLCRHVMFAEYLLTNCNRNYFKNYTAFHIHVPNGGIAA